jgi:Cys-rich protein (TIGR01571 family)
VPASGLRRGQCPEMASLEAGAAQPHRPGAGGRRLRVKSMAQVSPDEADDFERTMTHLGLIAHRSALAEADIVTLEALKDTSWDQMRLCGLPVPVRNRVLAWQNEEVYVPRWSSGTCACTEDYKSCLVGALCPCYAYNIIYIEAGVQPAPCGLFGCISWSLCVPFFPFLGCLARQHLTIKYEIRPKYPPPPKSSAVEDFCCHLFCHPCSLCQELREIGHRRATGPGGKLASDLVVKATDAADLLVPGPPPTPQTESAAESAAAGGATDGGATREEDDTMQMAAAAAAAPAWEMER